MHALVMFVGVTLTGAMQIDANYPGGNVVLERTEGNDVYLRPDLRDTSTWWFYWNFRVRGVGGRTIRFHFTGRNPIGVRGPAVSTDGGQSWSWLGRDTQLPDGFAYEFPDSAGEVRFAFAIPYLEKDFQRFIGTHRNHPNVSVHTLCRSRKGRLVERVHLKAVGREPRFRVLLTARHHACESMANFVLEGFLEAAMDDTEDGRWFQENVEVLAIPFVDKDGVEDGDQGKNRRPHDHNRDYGGTSLYPEVAALRAFVPAWSGGRLRVAIDLHCPWIRGSSAEAIHMVGSSDEAMWKEQLKLASILEAEQQGPLVYRAADNIPFGKSWNTAANYGGHKTCTMWAATLAGVRLATTIEIPYANVRGRTVDPATARAFGRDLAHAVRRYLEP